MEQVQHNAHQLASGQLPSVAAKIYPIGLEFLQPYLEPYGRFVDQPEEADFILSMNNTTPGMVDTLSAARHLDKPLAWWMIEDPNWFSAFFEQARQADFVFTTDEACITKYVTQLGHNRVFWLPLACSPEFHYPLAPADEVSDFVISANWYRNQARLWGVETVVEPLRQQGYSLTLFCYASFMWPPPYRQFWRGERHYRTVAEQYRYGRVVLGMNNQRSGMDGYAKTFMTSMRTFEALACGKPFLAAQSDAYAQLGFIHGEHMAWVDKPVDTLAWANRLLGTEGERMAQTGRQFVLSRHTYAHRLSHIAEIVLG